MSWCVCAVCDTCGFASPFWRNRSGLWRRLSRAGWSKSTHDRTFCPRCKAVAAQEFDKLQAKERQRRGK